MTDTADHDRRQLDRLVFFSDAVFAIAITLLVIEIKLPHFQHGYTEADLGNALGALTPQFIGFVVSFFVIGRFWIGHHRGFGRALRADDRLIWLNLLFLLTIAFMPFPTALLSNFAVSRIGVGVYTAWLAVAGLMNRAVVRYLTLGPLLDPAVDEAERRLWRRRAWAPVVVAALGFAAGMVEPLAAMVPLLASPLIVRLFGWSRRAKPGALPAA